MKRPEKKPVNLPVALIDIYADKGEAAIMIARATVMDLVRRGKISPDMGAGILGMRYEDFIALITGEEVPIIDYG